MARLVKCDVWRDGGSYSVTIDDAGEVSSLWLQVLPWDHPSEVAYETLCWVPGADPTAVQRRDMLDPNGERDWLERLKCLDTRAAEGDSADELTHLIAILERRVVTG